MYVLAIMPTLLNSILRSGSKLIISNSRSLNHFGKEFQAVVHTHQFPREVHGAWASNNNDVPSQARKSTKWTELSRRRVQKIECLFNHPLLPLQRPNPNKNIVACRKRFQQENGSVLEPVKKLLWPRVSEPPSTFSRPPSPIVRMACERRVPSSAAQPLEAIQEFIVLTVVSQTPTCPLYRWGSI